MTQRHSSADYAGKPNRSGIVLYSVGYVQYAYRICILDVEFDLDKAADNLRKHRVSLVHTEQALRDPAGVTVEDPNA